MVCPKECEQDRERLAGGIAEMKTTTEKDLEVVGLKVDGKCGIGLFKWLFGILISIVVAVIVMVAHVYTNTDNKFVSKDTFAISEKRTREDIREIKKEIKDSNKEVLEAIKELTR